jgi:hypothetical protein
MYSPLYHPASNGIVEMSVRTASQLHDYLKNIPHTENNIVPSRMILNYKPIVKSDFFMKNVENLGKPNQMKKKRNLLVNLRILNM